MIDLLKDPDDIRLFIRLAMIDEFGMDTG